MCAVNFGTKLWTKSIQHGKMKQFLLIPSIIIESGKKLLIPKKLITYIIIIV